MPENNSNAENKKPEKLTVRQNLIQLLKFAVFSLSAGAIQFVTGELLMKLTDLPYRWCYLPALVLSVVYNFTVNRRYTFKSANNVPIAMAKLAVFYLIFTPLSTWAGDAIVSAGGNEDITLIGTMLVNALTEFLACRFWVFRDSINTNDIAKRDAEKAKLKNTVK
ncbi:MAG: GtrA family protein [Candidatus Limivicinus sp.]|jgi:putative flippase GtrA